MKKLLLLLIVLALAGCASIKKVESGAVTVDERFSFTLEGAWNHLDFPGLQPARLWTMEGTPIDEFLIYSAIKDGEVMHPTNLDSKKKNFVFRRDMPIEEVVSLFEGVLTRDGSNFKLIKLEPYVFGGKPGFRFEYERIRKVDGVRQRGLGFGAVDQGELFALVYHAPRLTFFPRHQGRIEAIARSAVIR